MHKSIFVILVFMQVGAAECGAFTADPGFDMWCGENLCHWNVKRGEIRRVGTWHAGDAGAELVGPDSAIEQFTPHVSDGEDACVRFELIANIEESAEVFLHLDIDGDGTVEHSERIPTSKWTPVSFNLRIGSPYDGVRLEIARGGVGLAALAQISAWFTDRSECDGLTRIAAPSRANGGRCDLGTDCMSGICTDVDNDFDYKLACAGCEPGGQCASGMICGLGDPTSPAFDVPMQCVPQAARELGEQCLEAAECASGMCSFNRCSSCRVNSTSCGGSIYCGRGWPSTADAPFVCAPGERRGAPGAGCGTNADCMSSKCNGSVRMQCEDGRACDSSAACPLGGPCTTVGIQGGSCE